MSGSIEISKSDFANKPVIIFDGICNLCNYFVNFIIRRDKKGKLQFTPLQSDAGKKLQEEYKINIPSAETIIFINNDIVYIKSDAAAEIAKHLDGGWKLLAIIKIIPKFIRDSIYSKIAEKRYNWYGKKESCMIPSADIANRFL